MRILLAATMIVAPALAQSVQVRPAAPAYMPAPVDSNSPAFWHDGQFRVLNSANMPLISSGGNQFLIDETEAVAIENTPRIPMWIEAAWQDDDGVLFAWYHHEPGAVCPGSELTAPVIGALVSRDGGKSFEDLGVVLRTADAPDCNARNGFFAGGHGDFSVVLDANREYFYFYFSNYGGSIASQGIAVARMAFDDRYQPQGAVWKFYQGSWEEPGDGGRVTAVMPASVAWQRADTDSFWGPSIHWNLRLNMWVMLLNRACCAPRWPQEGIYIAYNADISTPTGWSKPLRIIDDVGFGPGWYPQVLGTRLYQTDTVASTTPRLYIHGVSHWELVFSDGPLEDEAPVPEPIEPVDNLPPP